jgi:hypothetical protein
MLKYANETGLINIMVFQMPCEWIGDVSADFGDENFHHIDWSSLTEH